MKRVARPRQLVQPQAVLLGLVVFLVCPTTAAVADPMPHLNCTPRNFRVMPGQAMRVELTVHARSAVSMRWHVPGDPLLKLRAFETLPVKRSPSGFVIYKRVVVWQALAPGTVKVTGIAVEMNGHKLRFPDITITAVDPGP